MKTAIAYYSKHHGNTKKLLDAIATADEIDLIETCGSPRKGYFSAMEKIAAEKNCTLIGIKKRIIIVNMGILNVVMYNPVIVKKDTPYETEEGCLSLTGVRKATRYQNIEVEYYDSSWKKHRQSYSGWTAQIIQHECDHLEGIII